MTAEETQQQLSDEFRSEREKLYKESAAEAERILQEQLEEEQRKAAEKLRRYEELVEQLESDLTKAEVEGEKIEEEFKQFMEQENHKAGVLDEDLEDYFNQNFQEGLVWPDEDYANCSEAIERANEDFRQNLEEKLQEKVEAVRQQVQKDEEKLTEDYLVFEEQMKKRREEIEQEYQTRIRGTRDPKKLEKIQKDRDHKLDDLEANEKLRSLEFERARKENTEKIRKVSESAEHYASLAAGGNPYSNPDSNERFKKLKAESLENDHQQAVLSARKRRVNKRLERVKQKLDNPTSPPMTDTDHRTKVMRQQLSNAPDEGTRVKVAASLHEELTESITETQMELSTAEKDHAMKVSSLAMQRKVTEIQAKGDHSAIEKRINRYNESLEDIEASMGSANPARQKVMSREKKNLQKAQELSKKDLEKLETEAEEKLKQLDLKHLKHKLDKLESLQSEVKAKIGRS